MTFTAGQIFTAAQANGLVMPAAAKLSDSSPVNNSTTLVSDAELVWALAASSTYTLTLSISSNSGTTPDIKFGWSVPSGTTMKWRIIGADTAGAVVLTSGLTEASVQPIGGVGADSHTLICGAVYTSTTAGNLVLQFAQNTANASNTVIRAGSEGFLIMV